MGDDENLDALAGGAIRFGFDRAPTSAARTSSFAVRQPLSASAAWPSRCRCRAAHNVANALACIAACRVLDVPLADMAGPLASFQGHGAALPDRRQRRAAST